VNSPRQREAPLDRAAAHIRTALPEDAQAIAALHAQSWRRAYRGILLDRFLDGPVFAHQLSLWHRRLADAKSCARQLTWVVQEGRSIRGFACLIPDIDPTWGALLDNLHVAAEAHGRGFGRKLIGTAARWLQRRAAQSSMHLWVYERNLAARRFYERCGAALLGEQTEAAPDGRAVVVLRYGWSDVQLLAGDTEASPL
jgi:GNAT superfamily N-acetyltransferase